EREARGVIPEAHRRDSEILLRRERIDLLRAREEPLQETERAEPHATKQANRKERLRCRRLREEDELIDGSKRERRRVEEEEDLRGLVLHAGDELLSGHAEHFDRDRAHVGFVVGGLHARAVREAHVRVEFLWPREERDAHGGVEIAEHLELGAKARVLLRVE